MTKSRLDSVFDRSLEKLARLIKQSPNYLLVLILSYDHRFSFTSELNSFLYERLTTRPCFEKEAKGIQNWPLQVWISLNTELILFHSCIVPLHWSTASFVFSAADWSSSIISLFSKSSAFFSGVKP